MGNRCLVIGDLNIDLIFSKLGRFPEIGSEILARESFMDIGGSGGIFSAVLSQLGEEIYIISEIGDDHLGRFLMKKLRNFGVKTDMVKINENKNTGITVTASYQKDKYQISELETINTMDSFKLERDIIEDISHIHFTSYYMMKKLIPKYTGIIEKIKRINESITFSLDTNDDPRESWNGNLKKVLKDIDIVFLNEKEALKISGSVNVKGAVEILKGLVDTVVVKLGSRGGMAYFSEETVEVKAIKTDFLDSTGAGDNFDAGFIFGHLKSLDLKSSLKIANICGGKSVGSMGGVGERERFLQLKKEINSII